MATSRPEEPTITVGELKQRLAIYDDDWEITFNGLKFCRLKARGPKLVQMEFEQTVYLDESGDVVVENHR